MKGWNNNYHIPEFVKCNQKPCADSTKPFEGSDVDVNPDTISDTAMKFPQWAALMDYNRERTSPIFSKIYRIIE